MPRALFDNQCGGAGRGHPARVRTREFVGADGARRRGRMRK
jgi:hypothetical protein